MEQKYKNGNCLIYNIDALILMKNLINKNKQVDCIVSDPPYPVTSRGNAGNSGGMCQKIEFTKGTVFKNNNCNIKEWAPLLYSLLKDTGHAYIMTNHVNLIEYLNILTNSGFHFIKSLIWNKGNKIMGQYYMNQFEYILFLRKGKGVKINKCGTSDILSVPNKKHKNEDGSNWHDTEKPVELMKILVENSTRAGEIVLDPFLGVGATAVACKELNRKFIGSEIDEIYYTKTIERLKGDI